MNASPATESWQLLSERDGCVGFPTDDTLREYVWGLQYVDEILERDRDTAATPDGVLDETMFYIQDANWNVITLLDADGNVDERYRYDAYGDPVFMEADGTVKTTAENSTYLFQGRRLIQWKSEDLSVNTYHFRRREQLPVLGRFLQRDPIGIWGDEANAGNGYGYVGNRPVSSCDPYGWQAWGPVYYADCSDPICACCDPDRPGPTQAEMAEFFDKACDKVQHVVDLIRLGQVPWPREAVTMDGRRERKDPLRKLDPTPRSGGEESYLAVLDAMLEKCRMGVTFQCECGPSWEDQRSGLGGQGACEWDMQAYTYPEIGDTAIHLCLCQFCNFGWPSRLVLHELSHFGGTTDGGRNYNDAEWIVDLIETIYKGDSPRSRP